jgi:hypothetical protein
MDAKLESALKEINSKRSFITFSKEILRHHDVLKKHYRIKGHDEYHRDIYDFDFRFELKGSIKLKFELLLHILDFDECEQTETLLRQLGWFFRFKSGFTIDQLIEEASYGRNIGDPRKHDLDFFHYFEKREWENFVKYFQY